MVKMKKPSKWALILGGSSGFGLATAKKLAQNNFDLIIVHRDRKSYMEEIETHFQEIASTERNLINLNLDAVNPHKRTKILTTLKEQLGQDRISVLVHSIAKGNLKPMQSQDKALEGQDFRLTIASMAVSLYDWTKAIVDFGLFAKDARIIAFTSEGSHKVWEGYAAVSAAKASLEAIVRGIALEFAPIGIKANCIQAGITDTRSFRMIPNSELLKSEALKKNPSGRLTTPEDIANAVYLLTLEESKWITGTTITVDGGESLR